MYAPNDPRAALSTDTARKGAEPASPAEFVVLAEVEPQQDGPGVRNWYVRGQNFIVNYAGLRTGAVITRKEQADEYMVLISEPGMGIRISAGDETREVRGPSLTIVPPGPSSLTALADGPILRLLTVEATDVLHKSPTRAPTTNARPTSRPTKRGRNLSADTV